MMSVKTALENLEPLASNRHPQVKHTWAMFAFLVAWAIEQVAWVNSDSSGRACYNVFNAKEASSIYAAVIAPVIVGAVVVGEYFTRDCQL